MDDKHNYYELFGVTQSASQDEIKRAYRKLAKKYHPDRNAGDATAEEKFKEVQQAYTVLSDAEKRAQYDQFGSAGVGQWRTDTGGQQVYQWGGGHKVRVDDLEDLMAAFGGGRRASVFDDLFGGQYRRKSPNRGADQEHHIALSFEQSLNGTTVTVRLSATKNGRSETLEVKIPPGVEEGQKIRLRQKGQAGRDGGPPGDLLLVCSIQPHRFFIRRGFDIHLEVPVSVTEAVLGAKIEVPSVDGRTTFTLPPGTPSGTKLRLKGRGIKNTGSDAKGNQFITVKIVPDTSLTDEQRKHYEELRPLDVTDPRTSCRWWNES